MTNSPEDNGFEEWFLNTASEKARAIVNRIGNIGNRPDLRAEQQIQLREILELVMEASKAGKESVLKKENLECPCCGGKNAVLAEPTEYCPDCDQEWNSNRIKGISIGWLKERMK